MTEAIQSTHHDNTATPDEILAVVQSVCDLPTMTATEAVALDDLVFDLLAVVRELRPLTMQYGSKEIAKLVRDRAGDEYDHKIAAECVRAIGRLEGEHIGRHGRRSRN